MSPSSSWNVLPVEMKLQVVDLLTIDEVQVLAAVDLDTYSLCVPSLFRKITLSSYEALVQFLDHVPHSYHRYVRSLTICTKPASSRNIKACTQDQTGSLLQLLQSSLNLEHLTLHLFGSPTKYIIPCFKHLVWLKSLHLSNCADERHMPLSERLVVSIALSVPRLEELTLDQVARSSMHASDLMGSYQNVPIVSNDDDIEEHCLAGSTLCLPSLLRIPAIRVLRIRNTHLGDPLWETTPCSSPLITVDLGSCSHVTPNDNRIHVERIINNIGQHCAIHRLAVNTNLEDDIFKKPTSPLSRLRHLCFTSFFPVYGILDTLGTIAGSPIETLRVQCYEDEITDLCSYLMQFLHVRVEQGWSTFFSHLKEIVISLVPLEGDSNVSLPFGIPTPHSSDITLEMEHILALRSFQESCRGLGLESSVDGMSGEDQIIALGGGGEMATGKGPLKLGNEIHAPSCPPVAVRRS